MTRRPTIWLPALFLPIALLLGCGTGAGDRAEEDRVERAEEDRVGSSPDSDPTSTPSGPAAEAVADAVADLADRLGVAAETVEVVAVEEVTWSDGSLGCAEPDRSYTQALVPGSRITLRAEGVEHEYHQGGSEQPFRCAEPTQ